MANPNNRNAAQEVSNLIVEADNAGIDAFKVPSKFANAIIITLENLAKEQKLDFAAMTAPDINNLDQTKQKLSDLVKKFDEPNAPSLYTVVETALASTGLPEDHPLRKAGRMLAVMGDTMGDNLGGTETVNAYHENSHLKAVVTNAATLGGLHNQLAGQDQSFEVLSPLQKAELIVAAAMHDLGHNGKGNGQAENHQPFLLEKQSFDLAEPILKRCGVSEQSINNINVMVQTTDVSGKFSPAKLADQIALGEDVKPNEQNKNIFSIVEPLKTSPALSQQAAILRGADILASTGLSEELAAKKTHEVKEEMTGERNAADGKFYKGFGQFVVGDNLAPGVTDVIFNKDWVRNRQEVPKLLDGEKVEQVKPQEPKASMQRPGM